MNVSPAGQEICEINHYLMVWSFFPHFINYIWCGRARNKLKEEHSHNEQQVYVICWTLTEGTRSSVRVWKPWLSVVPVISTPVVGCRLYIRSQQSYHFSWQFSQTQSFTITMNWFQPSLHCYEWHFYFTWGEFQLNLTKCH